MSLTKTRYNRDERLDFMEREVKVIVEDIKELYGKTSVKLVQNFSKLNSEDKVRTLYKYVTQTAKDLKIELA
jgi:hypothetical protein